MRNYHKQNDWKIGIFDAILKGIKSLILMPFKSRKSNQSKTYNIDKETIISQWLNVENLQKLGGPSRLKQSLIDADRILDLALKSVNTDGNTLGERLKNSQDKFSWSAYQNIWSAHKLRNEIVHENNREILAPEIISAVSYIKNGLRELGVL